MKQIRERKRYYQHGPPASLYLDDYYEIVEAIKGLDLQVGVIVDGSVLDEPDEIKTLPFKKPRQVVIFGSRRLDRDIDNLTWKGADSHNIGAVAVTLFRGGTCIYCGDEAAQYLGVCQRIKDVLERRSSWRAVFDARPVGLLLCVTCWSVAFIQRGALKPGFQAFLFSIGLMGLAAMCIRIMAIHMRVLLPMIRQTEVIRLLYPPPLKIRTRAEHIGLWEVWLQDLSSHVAKHGITLLIGTVLGYLLRVVSQ